MKAIIILPGTTKFSPAKLGAFVWSYEHNAHIYKGREFSVEEFNQVVDSALLSEPERTRRPTVRLIAAPSLSAVAPERPRRRAIVPTHSHRHA